MWTGLLPSNLGPNIASSTVDFLTSSGMWTYIEWIGGILLGLIVAGAVIEFFRHRH